MLTRGFLFYLYFYIGVPITSWFAFHYSKGFSRLTPGTKEPQSKAVLMMTRYLSVCFCIPQFTLRNNRGRFGGAGNDRKPLVLSTYLDAQEHLPYADDSNAVTPMSEENGAIIVPVYYANLGSRHSSYTSHQSRISYTSHGDLLGGMTKESRLRNRGSRNPSHAMQPPPSITMGPFDSNHKPPTSFQQQQQADGSVECTDETGKVLKQPDNPFIEPTQTQTVVDMKGKWDESFPSSE